MHTTNYELLAKVLRDDAAHLSNPEQPQTPYGDMSQWARGAYDQWNTLVMALATALKKENPRFNKDLFYIACGYRS